MPTERTFRARITDHLLAKGIHPTTPGAMAFCLPGNRVLDVKYTTAPHTAELRTIVFEVNGIYGPEGDEGSVLLRRRTVMDVEQLIEWNAKLLLKTLGEWIE